MRSESPAPAHPRPCCSPEEPSVVCPLGTDVSALKTDIKKKKNKNGVEVVWKSTRFLASEASFSCSRSSVAASDTRCGLVGERFAVLCLLCSLKASQQTLDAFVRPLSCYICCRLLVPPNRLLMISKLMGGLMTFYFGRQSHE